MITIPVDELGKVRGRAETVDSEKYSCSHNGGVVEAQDHDRDDDGAIE